MCHHNQKNDSLLGRKREPGLPAGCKPVEDGFFASCSVRLRIRSSQSTAHWKDFTSGCTIEARNFQRDLAAYEKAQAVILGVSVDTAESHKDFCAKEGLAFKLLADTETKVSESYGSVMEIQGKKLSARNTFIIDPQGRIAKVFPSVKVAKHSEEVLAALADLQRK